MATPDSTREVLLKFWKVVEMTHGLPTRDHKPSKSDAERMFSALATRAASDDEPMRKIRDDPAGAQSLFQVTLYKAALEGWETSTAAGLRNAKMPGVKLSLKSLATFCFCTAAAIEFPYVERRQIQ